MVIKAGFCQRINLLTTSQGFKEPAKFAGGSRLPGQY